MGSTQHERVRRNWRRIRVRRETVDRTVNLASDRGKDAGPDLQRLMGIDIHKSRKGALYGVLGFMSWGLDVGNDI